MQNKEFGRLLNEGIYSVAKNQGKKITIVKEEIGAAVGYSSSMVEKWKQGKHIPDAKKVANLVRYCLKHGRLNQVWADRILTQARHPNRKQLLREVFRSEDGGSIPEDGSVAPPLTEFNRDVLKDLETPGGAVKLRDEFYIERKADDNLQDQMMKQGTTTTIRAPRQTGKTSLLFRGIHRLQNRVGVIDLSMQLVHKDDLTSIDSFIQFLVNFITDELQLDFEEVEKLWRSSLPSNNKLTNLFRRYILPKHEKGIVLAIDEADRLLDTDFSEDFFGLIRSWHDRRARDEQWNKLNIVLVISTEPYLLIRDLRQSPFNVGYKIYLEDFDEKQVRDLNQRHGAPLKESELPQMMSLLGGQPYLTRMALYTLVTEKLTWVELSDIATTDSGPFGDHLRHHYRLLRHKQELKEALKEIIRRERCMNEEMFFCLEEAGLAKGNSDRCTCRCDLYTIYFKDRL